MATTKKIISNRGDHWRTICGCKYFEHRLCGVVVQGTHEINHKKLFPFEIRPQNLSQGIKIVRKVLTLLRRSQVACTNAKIKAES
jgi:hypothetical protein